MTERRIIIRSAPGGSIQIVVEPTPEWASHDAQRPTHREAKRYAESLRTVHGWRVVDESVVDFVPPNRTQSVTISNNQFKFPRNGESS